MVTDAPASCSLRTFQPGRGGQGRRGVPGPGGAPGRRRDCQDHSAARSSACSSTRLPCPCPPGPHLHRRRASSPSARPGHPVAAAVLGRQALMVPAHLRKGETYRDLAGGFGVGITTGLPVPARGPAGPGRAGPDAGAGDAGRGPQGVRGPGRDAAADRPGRDGRGPRPRLLQRQAQGARRERAGPGRSRRPTGLGVTGAARCPTRRRRRAPSTASRRHWQLPASRPTPTPPTTAPAPRSAHRSVGPGMTGPASRFVSRPLSGRDEGRQPLPTRRCALPASGANADLKNWRILRKIRSSPADASDPGQRRPGRHPQQLSRLEKPLLMLQVAVVIQAPGNPQPQRPVARP